MPMDYTRYPDNWPEISLRIRRRDGWQCKESLMSWVSWVSLMSLVSWVGLSGGLYILEVSPVSTRG